MFNMETIIEQLDGKIKQVTNLKSLFTRHISSTVYGYQQLKQFVQKDFSKSIKKQLSQYQQYYMGNMNYIVQQMMKRIQDAKKQKDMYKQQCFQLKQQVQRQQNVINLMKQQVEDLMILLNTQRIFTQKEQKYPQEQLKIELRQCHQNFQSGTLDVIQQQQTQRTIMSSIRSYQSQEKIPNYIKIQQKQIPNQDIQILSEQEISQVSHRLTTDPNPHHQSIFVPEQCSSNTINIQSNLREEHQYFQSEPAQSNQQYFSGIVQTQQQSLKDISNKIMNKGQSQRIFLKKSPQTDMKEDYQPKTKQFLEQFRKTFNKCLNSMHVSKKHSNKTNSKYATNNMQVTFGKNSSASSNKSSNYTSAKNKNNNQSSQKVETMLKNLDSSNKFTIGNKKIQLKYEGQKRNGNRNGHGILYYSNGLCYQGQFKQGYRHGYGVLKFNHIQIYNGEWMNDQIEGHGKIRNCAIINKRKSMNTSCLSKWISYSGLFKNSKFDGQGTLYLQGGQKFVGIFIAGNANGQGTIYRKNGQIQSGIWKNNILMDQF